MKITVAGAGYVGLSLATLLAQNNEVVTLEIHQDKADKVSQFISPIHKINTAWPALASFMRKKCRIFAQ